MQILKVGNIDVRVRSSSRAKRLSLRISHKGEAELVIPKRVSFAVAREFLIEHGTWLERGMKRHEKIEVSSDWVAVFGELYKIKHVEYDGYPEVVLADGVMTVKSSYANVKYVIIRCLKKLLIEEIERVLEEVCSQYEFKYDQVKISNASSKWGSCSSRGVLGFSWRLVFAPKDVIRYLVVHELCHLKEMNHSRKFWELVGDIYPEYKVSELWLKRNTQVMHRYLEGMT